MLPLTIGTSPTVIERGVEKMVGSQPPPACCHASHMISTLYRACSRGALGE